MGKCPSQDRDPGASIGEYLVASGFVVAKSPTLFTTDTLSILNTVDICPITLSIPTECLTYPLVNLGECGVGFSTLFIISLDAKHE